MPTLSVVIPAHRDDESFRRCLRAVVDADDPPHEVIVVSDGGPPSLREAAREAGAIVVHTPVSQGPAHARNCGAERATGDVLFFVDADVVVHDTAFNRVRAVFDDDPDCDALVGSYDDAPGDDGFFSQYRNLLHHYTHQHGRDETFTFWGACGAIRQDAFWASGGFDADYERPCVEDIEFGCRITEHGFRIRMCPSVQVKHLKAWSAGSMVKTDVLDRAMPWTQLLLEEGGVPDDLNLRWKERCSTVAAFLLPLLALLSVTVPGAGWAAMAVAAVFLGMNLPLYRFFYRKQGMSFSLRTIPWHWIYYLCCGTGAALGTATYALSQVGIRRTPLHELLPRSA